MGAIKKAFQAIGKGIEKAVNSVGQIAKGLATLNLKAAAAGLKGLASAGMDIARGAMNLMPAAMAANTLLDGALDKALRKVQNAAQKVADSVVDSVEGGLSNIKDGVVNTAKGIAKGNLSKALKGLTQLAMGAMETASNFGPGGVAKNMARMAVDATIDLAAQEATKVAAKVLDPNGTSRLGGFATDMVGAAVTGGLGSTRAGRYAGHDTGSVGFRQGAQDAMGYTARDAASNFAQEQISSLTFKLESTVTSGSGSSLLGGAVGDAAQSATDAAVQEALAGRRRHADGSRASANEQRRAIQEAAGDAAMQSVQFTVQSTVSSVIYDKVGALGGTGTGPASQFADAATDTVASAADAAIAQAFAGRRRNADGTRLSGAEQRQEILQATKDAASLSAQSAIHQAVDQFVQQVVARTILDAIHSSLEQLSPQSLKGLAALSNAPGDDGSPLPGVGNNPARQLAGALKQQMALSIELAVGQATTQATSAITDRLVQGVQGRLGGGNPLQPASLRSELAAITREAATQPIREASGTVFDAVQGAIRQTALQAVEQGLQDKFPLPPGGGAAVAAQVQIEARFSQYQIRA
ncbi:hypothetical protein [Paracidovorax konjaci]|uniref:Uncharacterized protein n=1 Tax=Paracidovorax konjaci TaxID=32040 RepID=A0A1I1V650_9BURK|nr:hypothetical protein [Paracidovorax konjaci]SFD78349.1 hypothetical protein SAMN04489710_10670 [Paracidovorax konjaci]